MNDTMLFAVILRFTVDYLLLMTANMIAVGGSGPVRLLLGALLGGIHAAGSMLPRMWFLNSVLWRSVGVIVMCLTAFEFGRRFFPCSIAFCLLRLSVDGLVSGTGTVGDILWAAVLCGVCLYGFRSGMGRQLVPVELCHNGKTVKLQALRDTGNTLRDPVTGKPVLVVDSKVADELTGLTAGQLMHPVETMGSIPGLRLVPYRAVGQTGGMLLALQIRKSRIGKQKGSALVAFAPQVLDEKGNYQALIGGMV